MSAYLYLFLAYTFIWVGLFAYIWFLHQRTAKLEQDLEVLRERMEISRRGDNG